MSKAVLFDLGDTVLEENSYDIVSGYTAISDSLSFGVTLEQLNSSIAKSQRDNGEFKLLEWISSNLSKSDRSIKAEDIELELWKATVSLQPKPSIREVLDFLAGENVRIAAISNAIFSSNCMRDELDKHNLGEYFEFIISSADVGIRKPDTRIFEIALSEMDIDPRDTWYIGDNWEADIVGATSAKMTAVWFKESFQGNNRNLKHFKLNEWSKFPNLWQQHSKSA